LNLYEEGTADFSDYVIGLCGRHEQATVTCTFDRRAATSPLFRLVPA
jgi:predicted nucleic-acid-binding protein